MKRKFFDHRLTLCYTDTDGPLFPILGQDVPEEFGPDLLRWFDTSYYPENSPFSYPLLNRKVIGFMKDE